MSPNEPGDNVERIPPPPSSRYVRAPQASMVKFKAELRKAVRKNRQEPEIDYLNITALLDLMTIVLVFTLQSMASSAASIQESDDLRLPRSIMQDEPSEEGVVLVISKTSILLGETGDPILKLPSREALAQNGIDAQHKRSGPNDLYVVPLANALQAARETDKLSRQAKGLDPTTSEAIIVADGSTPYRLLVEVLYTLGQSEFGKYHLMVMKAAAGHTD
ncbi:MAG: biopolymer transporter ExbD [Deltaproteobacteria bacterium]|nr:biopolymer transporter ExbD [Deltaproteobacteria bacterium]